MKKFIFLVSIVFIALTGYLQAQNIQDQGVEGQNPENQRIVNHGGETQANSLTTNQQAPQAVQATQTSQISQASQVSQAPVANNADVENSQTAPLNQSAQSNSDVTNQTQASPLQATHATQQAEPHSALSDDMSMMGMYRQAHPVVKAVMIGLFLASIATWTILVAKGFELFIAKRRAKSALAEIVEAKSLAALVQRFENNTNIGAYMVRMTEKEVKASLAAIDNAGSEGLKERVASQLAQIQSHASRRMARGTAIVATIGSIGPFVGLFGTVWGIMNSFIGIAQTKTTNLAVVAPGIAEALLATAIGLAAAIPAVVIYNILVRWIGGYRQNLSDCSLGIERLVSRDLDMRKAHRHHDERVAFAAE